MSAAPVFRETMNDAREVSAALAERIEPLCCKLLPAGHKAGAEWRVGSILGESGFSLGVHLNGNKAGVWSDFAGDDGGDALDLVKAVRQCSTAEALDWARNWLGVEHLTASREANEWQPILPAPAPPPQEIAHARFGCPTAVWTYRDSATNVLFQVCRFDQPGQKKQILPYTYGRLKGDPGWYWKAPLAPRPLFGLDKLSKAPDAWVILVEGEKAADAAQRLLPKAVAITWQGGCKAIGNADWSPLARRKVCYWPDHDDEGLRSVERMTVALHGAGCAGARVVEPPTYAPDKWDLADAEADGWTGQRTVEWIRQNSKDLAMHAEPQENVKPSWNSPKTLPSALPPVPVLSPEYFPPALAPWLQDVAERAYIPLDFVAAPAIVALSGLIGRTVGIFPKQQDDWLVVPNLWGAVIGRPGVLKSPAMNEALKPLRRLAHEAQERHKEESIQNEAARIVLEGRLDAAKASIRAAAKNGDTASLSSAEVDIVSIKGELDRAENHETRYLVNDPTIEKLGDLLNQNPRGLVLTRDELIGHLRGLDRQGHEQDRSFYLEAWAGAGEFTVDRIGRGTLHIPALTVAIIGGMTPGKLQSYTAGAIGGGAEDDGLLQRFQLAVWPDLPRDWVNVDRFPDTEAKNIAFDVFRSLDTLNPADIGAGEDGDIPALRFDPQAQELFDEFRAGLEAKIRNSGDGAPAFESHIAKYRSLLPSLALVFHLVEAVQGRAHGPVSLDAAKLAAAWCDYLEAHARRIYAGELNPSLRTARLLADKIKAGAIQDGMAVREIYRHQWAGLGDPETVLEGIRELEGYGHVKLGQKSTQGRTAEVIRINPALLRSDAA